MEKVILTTGPDFKFVASGTIPHFIIGAPDVITWGIRVFTYQSTSDEGVHSYHECFAVALVNVD